MLPQSARTFSGPLVLHLSLCFDLCYFLKWSSGCNGHYGSVFPASQSLFFSLQVNVDLDGTPIIASLRKLRQKEQRQREVWSTQLVQGQFEPCSEILSQNAEGWGSSGAVEFWVCVHKALCLIPSTTGNTERSQSR